MLLAESSEPSVQAHKEAGCPPSIQMLKGTLQKKSFTYDSLSLSFFLQQEGWEWIIYCTETRSWFLFVTKIN